MPRVLLVVTALLIQFLEHQLTMVVAVVVEP
jgi:hypothetical protein